MEKNIIQFKVIIHPASLLDKKGAGYWTEVVEQPVCFSEGLSIVEAKANTIKSINKWLDTQDHFKNRANIEVEFFMAL